MPLEKAPETPWPPPTCLQPLASLSVLEDEQVTTAWPCSPCPQGFGPLPHLLL